LDLGSQKELAGVIAKLEGAERTERWGTRPLIYLMSGDGEAHSGSSTELALLQLEVTLTVVTVERARAMVR
jgi:hypothetical protein